MSKSRSVVGILGTGSFGCALAKLANHNADILIYGRNKETVEEINNGSHALVDHHSITATNDLDEVAKNCRTIVPVIASAGFANVMDQIAPFLTPAHILIHGTKGLLISEIDHAMHIHTMSQLIVEKTAVRRVGCLSGPNLAQEIMDGQPTAAVVASKYQEVQDIGTQIFRSPSFAVHTSFDIEGAEVAGALKNIVALGTGVIEGLRWGKNSQAVFITKAWHESISIAKRITLTEPTALSGLAGIGDLIATATSHKSRNFSFGMRIGQNQDRSIDLQNEELAEGVVTLQSLFDYFSAQSQPLPPLILTLHRIVYENENPEPLILAYLTK